MSSMEDQPTEESTTELIVESIVSLSIDDYDRAGERILDGISVYIMVPHISTDTVGYFLSVRDRDTWILMISNLPHNFEGWCFKHGVTFLGIQSSDSMGSMGRSCVYTGLTHTILF